MTALAQEPWCFDTEQIARLTDYQLVHVYILPAVRRAEEYRKDSPATGGGYQPPPRFDRDAKPGDPGYRGPDYEPGTPGHRRQIVEMAFMGVMGMKREAAERLYEKQLQQWRDEQQKQG